MKDQIREALQAKFAGILKKLSAKALEQLVDQLASKVTEEAQIEDTLNGLDDMPIPFSKYVELLEGETDRRVRQAKDNLKKEFDLVPKKPQAPEQPNDPNGQQQQQQPIGDVQAMIAAEFKKLFEPFAQQLGSISETTQRNRLKEAYKTKGIPESWVDDVQIGNDFNIDEHLEAAEKKWNDTRQIVLNLSADEGRVPRGSNSPASELQKIKDYGKQSADLKSQGYNIQDNI